MSATTPATTPPTPLRPNLGAVAPPAVSTSDRLGLIAAIAAVGIALVAAVLYLSAALTWWSNPFLGVMTTHTLMVDGSVPITADQWAARNAGLRRADRIVGFNNEPFADSPDDFRTAFANFQQRIDSLFFRQAITVNIRRPVVEGEPLETGTLRCDAPVDGFANCSTVVILQRFSDSDIIGFFAIPYVSGVIVLIVGAGLLLLRPNTQVARIASLGLVTLSIYIMGLFDLNTTSYYPSLWIIAAVLGAGSFIALAMIFPVRVPLMIDRPTLRFAPPLIGFAAGLAFTLLFWHPFDYLMPNNVLLTCSGLGLLSLIVLTLRTLYVRSRTTSLVVRDQSNSILIGIVLAMLVALVWLANLVAQSLGNPAIIPLNTSAMMPFFVMPALSIAYAALQYRLFDTDRLISQGVTYTVMLASLIGGYFLLVFAASLITRDAVRADNPLLIAIIIFFMAVLFVPVRTRLQEQIERLYFRKRYNYQAKVEEFAQQLSTLAGIDDVLRAYRQQIDEVLQPRQVYIFLPNRQSGDFVAIGSPRPETDVRFAADSPMLSLLYTSDGALSLAPGLAWPQELVVERARLLILKAMVLIPLKGTNQINGFVILSVPRAEGSRYTYEQIRFLQGLTSQVSVAVERAQVVDSLERRVNELDVLSSIGQAINFAVEFDDLLELIATQSDRLVPATHFYIALRAPNASTWEYVFFMEDEERLREREGRAYPLGRDLISDVFRTGQPIRVADYAAVLSERGITAPTEDPNLRAWIAVPMLVGSSVSGVLAAGTTQMTRSYSDDQMRVFADVGALAAASIEKARLFAETNVRARQLGALNDISRKLVAIEFDIENLLQLITASSADILESEAGSLLLTTDDNTGDLEFRVVIGGSGTSIIGKRVEAGKGLVGEVARSAQPVIVNDVPNDPRWAGELGKGAFRTHTVLAVPLITQDRVIGVLELLNKRTGIFSQDDAALLTTFAGQAAVAIENARLFQMTDKQLSQRLSELETLERIDVELNRSLDLRKVAEITVSWAVENSAATAALLGVVVGGTEGEQRLEIVYQTGYGPNDAPNGAEGHLWPLDKGIAARVLRTRQPDLVTDVSIDRDYVPSLHGGISQITMPMLSGGTVNALLILETNREPRFRIVDMAFLQRLVEHASIAIANAQLYAELTRANASKSEFVSFVAHELKNPLTSIKGYSDFLLGGVVGGLNDQQMNFLSTIRGAAERMNTIVSDLNDVTKLQTNNLRLDVAPIDFHAVITETLRPLQKQIEDKGQTIALDLPPRMPLIQADQNRLIQVLTNLVSNAHKYSPTGGTIAIGAETLTDNRDRKGRQTPPMLRVHVADTGIGMSEEDQAKLFTPYFRSTNPEAQEQPGTGLGLTITRGIIERHGGEIWLDSRLGEGTTFYFTVPLAAETVIEGGA